MEITDSLSTKTFFFYDLETSGFNPREARIMQFAGQRTDLELNPIGKPVNTLIRISEDVLPDPQAILITGISPQKTIAEGMTEAEFLKFFYEEISIPNTIFVGYNSVRFDDEFIRFLNYRNFYDPYEWFYKNGNSRWDLLDVVRMTRALRPDGIFWPKDKDGKPTNRLEELAKLNKIIHEQAHDALSDVRALIGVAEIIRKNQPKLFDYLLKIMTDKKQVEEIVKTQKPFLYTSGKYLSEYEKTTVVAMIADHPKRTGALVYDLREDPNKYLSLPESELFELWMPSPDKNEYLPVKTLQFNRCPAVAPISVLDYPTLKRLSLDQKTIENNFKILVKNKSEFTKRILNVITMLDEMQEFRQSKFSKELDSQLYDRFYSKIDKQKLSRISGSSAEELKNIKVTFEDERLNGLLLLYKARNYPKILNYDELKEWQTYKKRKLTGGNENSRLAHFFQQLNEISNQKLTKNEQFLIEELKLYGESLIPIEEF